MKSMELSQSRIAEDKRMRGTVDSGVFSSNFGTGFVGKLHVNALDWPDFRNHQALRPAVDRL